MPKKPLLNPLPLALLAASLLAGCATSVPPVPPLAGVTPPEAWSAQPVAATAPGPALWRAFGDATLDALIGDALAANTDLLSAAAQLRQARAARDAAAAALQPTLGASATAGRSRTPPAAAGNVFKAGFEASWEPDFFGANAHAAAAAEADAAASAATLAATRLTVAGEVALDYLALRGTQARLALARSNLASQEETARIAGWRAQAGLATTLEVAQAQTAVEQTRAQIPALEASAAQSRHALAVLTGRLPAALDSLLAPAAALPEPPAGLGADTPAATLRRRPDVLAAEKALEAAARRVAEQDAARRPQLALSASLAWSALTLGGLGGQAAAASLLGNASQPLFDGGQRSALLQQREAAFDAARATYAARVLGALQDVEDALAQLNAARERLQALRAAERSARDAALLATQRYASGIVDFQTVLETQRTLLGVQDSTASVHSDWASAHVRVLKALGVPPVQEKNS